MNDSFKLVTALFLAAVLAPVVVAQEDDGDGSVDDTIVVVDENADPEDIINILELPETASDRGRESSAKGLATANAARENGREFGQQMSEDARSNRDAQRDEARQESRGNVNENAASRPAIDTPAGSGRP